jgi:hypothetical protein
MAEAQGELPETVREHYRALPQKASDCVDCGSCEDNCPFGVQIIQRMQRTKTLFGE